MFTIPYVNGPGAMKLMCYLVTTGASCSGSYPLALTAATANSITLSPVPAYAFNPANPDQIIAFGYYSNRIWTVVYDVGSSACAAPSIVKVMGLDGINSNDYAQQWMGELYTCV